MMMIMYMMMKKCNAPLEYENKINRESLFCFDFVFGFGFGFMYPLVFVLFKY